MAKNAKKSEIQNSTAGFPIFQIEGKESGVQVWNLNVTVSGIGMDM